MCCSHKKWRSIFFSSKAPFTHRFQITGKFCGIINQKLFVFVQCCVCKHEGVYTISVFVDVFIFCQTFTFMQLLLGQRHRITWLQTQRGVNASSASECYDWPRAVEVWISTALYWPGVDILHQHVLNLYELIPVIFNLRSHKAEFQQFTGNVTTSHIAGTNLPVFLKRSCSHEISLQQFTGNFPVKSLCVKGANELKLHHWATLHSFGYMNTDLSRGR